jgi:uncharacterized protein (TIGR02147 family)
MQIPGRAVNVFEFKDYRQYLQAVYRSSRDRNENWSYTAFAKKLGLKSNSSILKVMRGQRHAGPSIVEKVAAFCQFTTSERNYFESLVALSKAKALTADSLDTIRRVTGGRRKDVRVLDTEEFDAIGRWWFYAIRQMVRLKGFSEDPAWITKQLRFKISLESARLAVATMLRLGLLTRCTQTRRLVPGVRELDTSDDMACEALRTFHEGMIENSRRSLRSIPVQDRNVTGYTLGIKQDSYDEAKKYLNGCFERFAELFAAENPDVIYQAQFQLFPLTHPQRD